MISVIMPTHNRPPLLELTIASVLSQDYDDYEFIVVDASPNRYFEEELDKLFKERLQNFADKRSKIKIVYPDCNIRFPGAVKMYGVKNAVQDNDMIIFLDHDDLLGADVLKYIPISLKQYPTTEMITTDYITLCYDGNNTWVNPISFMGGNIYKTTTDPIVMGDILMYFPEVSIYKSTHPYIAALHPQIVSKQVIRDRRVTFIEDTEIGDDCIWGLVTHSLIETRIPIIGYIYMAYLTGYATASTESRVANNIIERYSDDCKRYSEILDRIGYKKPKNEVFI